MSLDIIYGSMSDSNLTLHVLCSITINIKQNIDSILRQGKEQEREKGKERE